MKKKEIKHEDIDISEIEKMFIGIEDILTDEEEELDKYFIDNLTNILKGNNNEDIYEVLQFFNEKEDTRQLFEKLVHQKINEDRPVNIIFGDELGIKELEDFSFVYSVYNISGAKGIIGIMGPKRMAYSKTIGLIEHVSHELNIAIEQLKKYDDNNDK